MAVKVFLEGYELDTMNDTDVDFTFSIIDLSDIERRNTSFSKTLSLPNTPTNQKLFGSIFDVSVQNDYYSFDDNVLTNFNPSKLSNCQIYLDGVRIFDGVLRLIKISNTNGNITYETNVFGKLNDILASIGDKTLDALDWSDYDHIYSLANVEDSWSRTGWEDGELNYVYPLVDYGLTTDGVTYPFQNFRPALFIREILKRIFKESGFRIISPFFDTTFFKNLLLIPAEKNIVKLSSSLENAYCTSDAIFKTIVTGGNYSGEFNAPFQFRTENGFISTPLLDGYYYVFKWNQLTSASVNIAVNYKFFITNNTIYDTTYRFFLKKNGVTLAVTDYYNQPFLGGNEFAFNFIANVTTEVAYNDLITISYSAECSGIGNINSEFAFSTGTNLQISNSIPVAINILEDDQMTFKDAVPKSIKQRDFLKSIITMFNLYVTPDKLEEKVLEFVPHTLFYRNKKNQSIDWTDKVDTSQKIDITPLSEMSAREYRIGYADDTDYWSAFYKAKFNQSYGESNFIADNDFELDTKTIKVIFGCPVMREEAAGRKLIHIYKVENNIKVRDNFKPRIAYWKPDVPTTTWNIQSNISGLNPYLYYPYAGHFDNPVSPTSDLLFGVPKEVYFVITSYPPANLFNAFYEALITAITNKDSRLISANVYLNPVDILNLDFRDIIKVGKHYYELHKIDKYNPINNGTCVVHLFKILGDVNPLVYDPAFLLNEDDTLLLQENGTDKFYI